MFDRLAAQREEEKEGEKEEAEEQDSRRAADQDEEKDDTGAAMDVAAFIARLPVAASLFSSPPHSHHHAFRFRSAYAEHRRRLEQAQEEQPRSAACTCSAACSCSPSPSPSPSSSSHLFEPAATNFTATFQDCLDFIFYCPDRLSVEAVLPLPDSTLLSAETALPNSQQPSDHLRLQAHMSLTY